MLQEIRLESFFPADQTTVAHRWEHHPRAGETQGRGLIEPGEIPP